MRPIQLTPFEVQSSYGGTVAGRHNLDVQDMRRVLDPASQKFQKRLFKFTVLN